MFDSRLSVVTIGAGHLETLRAFYADVFGWTPVAANADILFYRMNGFLLSFCDRRLLADTLDNRFDTDAPGRTTLGYNVDTAEAVRELYAQLAAKGVSLLTEPIAPPFGGLFFYFEDPEGNCWEVACNPYVTLDDAGNAAGHLPIDHL